MKEIFEAKMFETMTAMMNRYRVYEFQMPTLEFKRIGTTAGRAFYTRNLIQINPDYLRAEYEKMLNVTLPHEVAHLVAYKLFGDSGHGAGWRKVMMNYGLTPDRCHSYDSHVAKLRKTRKFEYICPKCQKTFLLGLCLHRRSMDGEHRIHPECNARVVFTGKEK